MRYSQVIQYHKFSYLSHVEHNYFHQPRWDLQLPEAHADQRMDVTGQQLA